MVFAGGDWDEGGRLWSVENKDIFQVLEDLYRDDLIGFWGQASRSPSLWQRTRGG
jgi:hypothetical protein